jgi:signal transduction histidine kinase
MMRWRGVTLQLFLFVFAPLTALTLAVALGSVALHEQAMRQMVGERDERAARAAAASMTAQLNRRLAAVQTLALYAAAVPPETAVADYAFLLTDFERGLALFNADGEPLAILGAADWQSWPLADLPPAATAQLLPAFAAADGEKVTLAVATNEHGATAVGAFSATGLARQALAGISGGGHPLAAFVVDQQRQTIFLTGHHHPASDDLLTHPGVAPALRGESGATYLTLNGQEHVVVFSPVPPAGWGLIIEEPWQMVAGPTLRATQLAPLILAPVVLIALLLVWFGARQIVRPLQTLADRATELGRGDFTAIEEPAGGIAEIGRLQAELIEMARKVSAAQDSLRRYAGAIAAGQEEERRRLARELHDDTIQTLIALNQRAQLAQRALVGHPAHEKLAELETMVAQAIGDARRFARALRPIYLEDLGLTPALEMLTRDTAANSSGANMAWELAGEPRRLPPETELTLYRMAQEALNNALRHAEAGQITIQLRFEPEKIALEVADDGRGFVPPNSLADMAPQGHFGLLGLNERAQLIGADLRLRSAPGQGTTVTAVIASRNVSAD